MREAQTSLGSPIETQTSVQMMSAPFTPAATSSVMVICAPESAANRSASPTTASPGWNASGATMRTSEPISALETRIELPML